jgi:hypothetical protein
MVLAVMSTVIVTASIAWAIREVGTPGMARLRDLDRARISDLQTIRREVVEHYEQNSTLPSSLQDLGLNAEDLTDPVSGESYGYAIKSPRLFQLSADFSLSSGDDPRFYDERIWRHDAGPTIFTFDVPKSEKKLRDSLVLPEL